ncbi:hypothetical protein F2Q70_00029079 [Brassica cretica]|uniref:ceramide glucosyltransferase n=2 Tax=Brassica TaxID=3705 RepID=A0A8S9FPH1_BRACR|nr:hypothetical protein F2Q70_00029079 [Brassica cretica]
MTQGCVICLLLALGWLMAAYVRNREIKRIKNSMKAGNSLAFLYQDINELEHSRQAKLPRVSVVMPLKGFGEHNLHNWRSQITSLYGGPLEFLFVLESTQDPAYHAVSRLLATHQIGVEKMHIDTKYVLFLDDDVSLHPGTIGALTSEMEKNPEIFIQTGYPLDLPSGTLGSYCIYEYHMASVTVGLRVAQGLYPGDSMLFSSPARNEWRLKLARAKEATGPPSQQSNARKSPALSGAEQARADFSTRVMLITPLPLSLRCSF